MRPRNVVTIVASLALTALAGRQSSDTAAALGAEQNAREQTPPHGYALLTDADIRRAFEQIPRKPPTNKKIVEQQHYSVAVARVVGRNGPVEHHRDADRLFFVKSGAAKMRVGGELTDREEVSPGEYRSKSGTGYANYRTVKMEAGAVLSVPRDVPYQLVAEGADVSFIVVRMQ